MTSVFLTGSTGYMGTRLARRLVLRGHVVRALARPGSERKVPEGCEVVPGDALDAASYERHVQPGDTFVHLVGVAHPSPAKAEQFRTVDLASVRASTLAAVHAGVAHFVYVSVAQPAPAMKAYVEARAEGEALVRATGIPATILRPWYVLGPGHWWPIALLPGYAVALLVPSTRDAARRLMPVRLPRMLAALVHAVEHAPEGVRIVEAPEISRDGLTERW